MAANDITREIARCVEALPLEQQQQILSYAERLQQAPRGESGTALLSFAGALDPASGKQMIEAIESACEGIHASEW